MKVISFDKIMEKGITPLQCYEWVCESLRHKDEAILPAKISLKPGIPGVFYNTMPCVLGTKKWGGGKTSYPLSGAKAQPRQHYSSL